MNSVRLTAVVSLAILTLGACSRRRPAEATVPVATTEPAREPVVRTPPPSASDEDAARMERERRSAAARATLEVPIYYDFDRSDLLPAARTALDAKLPILQANANVTLRVEGHADERGSDEYNLALSQRRAAAAKRYLQHRGIAESRISVVGFGEERPVCDAEMESCWSRNRRAEFVVTSGAMLVAAP